jgi:hypothetical protein
LVAVSTAIAADPAAVSFARGVSAYVREEYVASQQAFGEAVQLAPASPDAWANYGTASWAMADTAAAVLAWRRGLALEPNATDLQQYLMVVRDLGPTSPGWVPALPRNATVWVFGLLWMLAWGSAWVSRRQRTAAHAWWTSRLPLPLAAGALVVGLAAIEIESRIAGNRLAVVRRAMTLSSDPAIGMDRGPLVGTGEIVRVVGRRGGWARVEATDDRDGWIASAQLFDVANRRLPRD